MTANTLTGDPPVPRAGTEDHDPRMLEDGLREIWNGGEAYVVGWTPSKGGLSVAWAGAPCIFAAIEAGTLDPCEPLRKPEHKINRLADQLSGAVQDLHVRVPVGSGGPGSMTGDEVERCMRGFAIAGTAPRALARIQPVAEDRDGSFTAEARSECLWRAIAKVTTRSSHDSTGIRAQADCDGVLLWNDGGDDGSLAADIALYHTVIMILGHVALQDGRRPSHHVPRLSAVFTIAEQHRYLVRHGGSEHTRVIGPTPDILRWVSGQTLPDQILMVDFCKPAGSSRQETGPHRFVLEAMQRLKTAIAQGTMVIDGVSVEDAMLYLTGERLRENVFYVNHYGLDSPDGRLHTVFNAKANLRLHQDRPLYLGLLNDALDGFEGCLLGHASLEGDPFDD